MDLFSWRGLGRWWMLLVLLAPLGLSGCGPGTATVSGKVTIDGKVVKAGNLTFIPSAAGKQSRGTTINEDGTYKIEHVPVGTVTICVETESLNPAGKIMAPRYKPPAGQQAPEGFGSGDSAADAAKRYVAIPKKYAEADKSGLTYEVKSGTQEYDIELKK